MSNKLVFHATAGFPNVVAAIDCTHMTIKSPSVHKERFVNRKNVHTINVQAAWDNMKLLNVVAKFPGSSHDAFIWSLGGFNFATTNMGLSLFRFTFSGVLQ